MEPGFEDLKITFQPRQAGRPTGHISHTGQDLLRGSTSAADCLAGEPDANDADVVEILAFQSGLTMPLTGLGRLAEGVSVAPPVLSATHVWITRGNRAAMARLARSGANPTLETRVTCFTEKEIYAAGDRTLCKRVGVIEVLYDTYMGSTVYVLYFWPPYFWSFHRILRRSGEV